MTEKALDEAEKLNDEVLDQATGGSRVLSACSRINSAEFDDEARDTSIFSSAARLNSANNDALGAAARLAANEADADIDKWSVEIICE